MRRLCALKTLNPMELQSEMTDQKVVFFLRKPPLPEPETEENEATAHKPKLKGNFDPAKTERSRHTQQFLGSKAKSEANKGDKQDTQA